MKLIIAIVNSDDVSTVIRNLSKNGFSSTSLATTGGFLMRKNVTCSSVWTRRRFPLFGTSSRSILTAASK